MNPPVRAVVLDTEAVSSLALSHRPALARLKAAADLDAMVVAPSIVLAELMTGRPSDAAIWRIVNGLDVHDVTCEIAAVAGRLRERADHSRRKKRDLTVDAVVAAIAVAVAPSVVITSDIGDLALLTTGYDVKVLPA
jgi:predicted nucleic acid-binding protein